MLDCGISDGKRPAARGKKTIPGRYDTAKPPMPNRPGRFCLYNHSEVRKISVHPSAGQVQAAEPAPGACEPAFLTGLVREEGSVQGLVQVMRVTVCGKGEGDVPARKTRLQAHRARGGQRDQSEGAAVAYVLSLKRRQHCAGTL